MLSRRKRPVASRGSSYDRPGSIPRGALRGRADYWAAPQKRALRLLGVRDEAVPSGGARIDAPSPPPQPRPVASRRPSAVSMIVARRQFTKKRGE